MTWLFHGWTGRALDSRKLRLRRVLALRCETRVYFGNGELTERQVVAGEQGKRNLRRDAKCVPRKPRGSRPNTAIIRPQRSSTYPDYGFKLNVETTPVQARSPWCAPISCVSWSTIDRRVAGESAVGKSRCFPTVRLTRALQKLIHIQFGSQIRERSV